MQLSLIELRLDFGLSKITSMIWLIYGAIQPLT